MEDTDLLLNIPNRFVFGYTRIYLSADVPGATLHAWQQQARTSGGPRYQHVMRARRAWEGRIPGAWPRGCAEGGVGARGGGWKCRAAERRRRWNIYQFFNSWHALRISGGGFCFQASNLDSHPEMLWKWVRWTARHCAPTTLARVPCRAGRVGRPSHPTPPTQEPTAIMAGALPLESVIGFEGKVSGELVLHPNGKTMAGVNSVFEQGLERTTEPSPTYLHGEGISGDAMCVHRGAGRRPPARPTRPPMPSVKRAPVLGFQKANTGWRWQARGARWGPWERRKLFPRVDAIADTDVRTRFVVKHVYARLSSVHTSACACALDGPLSSVQLFNRSSRCSQLTLLDDLPARRDHRHQGAWRRV